MILFHNPRCSKSRQAKELLENKGIKFEVREYLKTGISTADVEEIISKMGMKASEFIRKKEKIIKEEEIDLSTESRVIKAITIYPILLERPLLLTSKKAIIGRPPEKVLEII